MRPRGFQLAGAAAPGQAVADARWRLWLRLLLGLAAVFALFQWTATGLGSDRGQAGLIVGAIVLAALLVVERAFFGLRFVPALRALGFGAPTSRALAAAAGASVALLLAAATFVLVSGSTAELYPGALWLLPGLFAQSGIAEEALFRGYLFRRLRAERSFWAAAAIATLPFVAVHGILFLTLPWPVALASLLLAAVISFPLAHLFELGGGTLWAPALLHFVVQSTVKIVVAAGESAALFPVVWIWACLIIPLGVLCVRRQSTVSS